MNHHEEIQAAIYADLTERADRAREALRTSDGGNLAQSEFICAMRKLGFDWTGIQIELNQNMPGLRPISEAAERVVGGLR